MYDYEGAGVVAAWYVCPSLLWWVVLVFVFLGIVRVCNFGVRKGGGGLREVWWMLDCCLC